MKIYSFIAIYTILALSSLAIAQESDSCSLNYEDEPNFIVNEYAAYSIKYDASEQATIQAIADFAIENLNDLGTILVMGHSSVYGNSDIQVASELRAETVLNAIISVIEENVGEEAGDYYAEYDGVGGDCPLVSNSTQAGRAENRRVEVWLIAKQPDHDDPQNDDDIDDDDSDEENPQALHREYKDMLTVIQEQTDNAATRCIAKKLQKEESDLAYLAARAINKALNMPESKKAAKIVKKATRQLRSQAEAVYQRIVESTETIVKTPEQRLMRFINQKRRSLMQGINLLDAQANCQNPRIIAMRKFVVNHMKKKNSIYSCKPIKKRVKAMLASIGGEIKGCSAN